MRITAAEATAIRRVTKEVAGEQAWVRLFGSRTDNTLKGGDIDLWITLPTLTADKLSIALKANARLQLLIGERKIDVLVTDAQSEETPLVRAARRTGILQNQTRLKSPIPPPPRAAGRWTQTAR